MVYSLGLVWADQHIRTDVAAADLWHYARMLLGLTLWDKLPETRGCGCCRGNLASVSSMGLLGLVLAVWGTVAARRQYGWVLLGWGMFLGNLCYYLYNHRWTA